MAPSIPSVIPDRLVAGTTWRWTASYGAYPISEGWTLSYVLRGVNDLDTEATDLTNDGTRWTVTVAIAKTKLEPGLYTWAAYMTGSGTYAGQVHLAQSGTLLVQPDVAGTAAGELVAFAEKALARIETRLLERISEDMSNFTFAQKQTVREDIRTLQRMRTQMQAELQRKKFGRLPPLHVHFGRA